MANLTIDLAEILAKAGCTQAVIDVAFERLRQIREEGWTPEHDDQHGYCELSQAASCYALSASGYDERIALEFWPFSLGWWKPKGARRDLVRAAALIIAEIERLDRSAVKEVG
jgi:hypothetical protein